MKTADIFGPDAATDIARIRRQLTFNLSLFRLLVVVGLDVKMKGENWMNGTKIQCLVASPRKYSAMKGN